MTVKTEVMYSTVIQSAIRPLTMCTLSLLNSLKRNQKRLKVKKEKKTRPPKKKPQRKK